MNNTQWISVKDRLPEEDGDYLATYYTPEGDKEVSLLWFVRADDDWLIDDDHKITHWQTLPEPASDE